MSARESTTAEKKQRFAQLRQIKQVFDMTRKADPSTPWWMLGAFLGLTLLFVLIGLPLGYPVYLGFIGALFGVLAATFLLSRRAEKAAYAAIEGQPGQSVAVFQGLRRGNWSYDQQPAAVDAGRSSNVQDAALVFRAVGLPGVVLVAEGPAGRAERLLAAEVRKVTRLLPNVPVTTYRVGEGTGENVVTARELAKRLPKLKKSVTKEEARAISKRLRAMSGPRSPIPQGVDPQRLRQTGRGPRR